MALNISNLGISFPSAVEVLSSVQSRLEAADSLITNLNAGGVAETILEAIAVTLGSDASTIPGVVNPGAYELLGDVLNQAFISSATGYGLDLKAADVGVTRKPANPAAGGNGQITLRTVSGTDTVFAAGAIVSAEAADPTQPVISFVLPNTNTVPAGQTVLTGVVYRATQAGSAGNQPVGAINQVVSGLSGATFVNLDESVGGTETEQDDSPNGGLRARALAAIPNASQCTNAALVEAALSYPGIISADVVDYTDSTFTMFVRGLCQLVVDDGTGTITPSSPVVAQLIADLNAGKYRAAGDVIQVVGATHIGITVALSVYLSAKYIATTASQASIVLALQNAVQSYINSLPIGSTLYLSEVIAVAQAVAGLVDVVVPTVLIGAAAPDTKPPANADYVPTLPYYVPHMTAASSVTVTVAGTV